jgi:NADP-dependent 3-hydroxy acid dehydrogenase YdfG
MWRHRTWWRFDSGWWLTAREGKMFDLTGKSALVTGASGRFWVRAVRRLLHRAGAIDGSVGHREAPLQTLAKQLGTRAMLPCNLWMWEPQSNCQNEPWQR